MLCGSEVVNVVVIVIIGVLAAIAIPQFGTIIERARVGEAIIILDTLRSSQMRFLNEHGSYQAEGAWNDAIGLDVNLKYNKYFSWVPRGGSSQPFYNCSAPVARVDRNNFQNSGFGNYHLCIEEDGTIRCLDSTEVAGTCTKLGY